MHLLATKQICHFLIYLFLVNQEVHDHIFAVSDSNPTEKSQLLFVPIPPAIPHSPPSFQYSPWREPHHQLRMPLSRTLARH